MASQTTVKKISSSTKRTVASLQKKAKDKDLDLPVLLGGLGALVAGGGLAYFSRGTESRIIWWTKWLLMGGGALTTVGSFGGKNTGYVTPRIAPKINLNPLPTNEAPSTNKSDTNPTWFTNLLNKIKRVFSRSNAEGDDLQLFKEIISDYNNPETRLEAEEALIKNPDKSITKGLIDSVNKNKEFAPDAASILVKRCYGENSVTDGFSYNAEGILLKALEEGHETVKVAIAYALCEVPRQNICDDFLTTLQRENSPNISISLAIKTLQGKIAPLVPPAKKVYGDLDGQELDLELKVDDKGNLVLVHVVK